jgi:AraC family transcriptional regulator
VLRQISTPQFRFTLGSNAPLSVLKPHIHEEYPGIVFVADGDLEESYAGDALTTGSGGLMLKMHNVRHANRFGPRGAKVVIIEQLQPMPLLKALPGRPSLKQTPFVRMIGSLVAHELEHTRGVCDIGLTSHAVDLWGVAAAAKRSGRSPKIARAVQLIHDDIVGGRRIDALARSVDAHPVYLARGFRAQFGQSLHAYVMRVRLARAMELVRQTRRSFADIAAELGFADQAHMTRAFRSYYGRTPMAARREAWAGLLHSRPIERC